MNTSIVRGVLPKTNRLQLVRALWVIRNRLPTCLPLEGWRRVAEEAYCAIDLDVWCHRATNHGPRGHAQITGELHRFENASYQCNIQWDIAMLNRDTQDPSGANSDPLFPRESHWIFYRSGSLRCLSLAQLEFVYHATLHFQLKGRYIVASDGHLCLSTPEVFVDEFLTTHGIEHQKEGDIDRNTGERFTAYPYDAELNCASRGRRREADWIVHHPNGGIAYVEFFEGSRDPKKYAQKTEDKIKLCRRHNLDLIALYRRDLKPDLLEERFAPFLLRTETEDESVD